MRRPRRWLIEGTWPPVEFRRPVSSALPPRGVVPMTLVLAALAGAITGATVALLLVGGP